MNNLLPLAHLEVKFILDGKTYEAETFKISFDQPKDFKGQPQHEVTGGQFMIGLTQIADKGLYVWARTPTMTKSGEILFQTDLGMTVYRIEFNNAYCITLTRDIDASVGTKTLLMIAPEQLFLNGIEHYNFWS